ncbi:MAG: hypothetical protein LBS72_08025 [Oscillospiraceae bacterium]|nr:hypothetical protein [Oscillospiraceae bacterium]
MKQLRRLLWFITVRLFALCVISALLVVTFYLSMNITNIVILLKDGMAARAQVVLGIDSDISRLEKFFTQECLQHDANTQRALVGSGDYKDYDIRGLDHRLSMEWIWSWPWEDTASAIVVESVPAIDGKVKTSLRSDVLEQRGEEGLTPPEWREVRYRVTLARLEGRWIISALTAADS